MKKWSRLTEYVHRTVWKKIGKEQDRKLEEEIRQFHPGTREEIQLRADEYRKKQIQSCLFFFLIFGVAFGVFGIGYQFMPGEIRIERNSYGEGEREDIVVLENGDTLQFIVEEQEYSKEKLEQAFLEGFIWVREEMLLENESAAQVHSNLNFMTEVPGGLRAEWISDREDILGSNGQVFNEDMEEEVHVNVQLTLSYKEEKQSQNLTFCIKAPVYSPREQLINKIKKEIQKREEETREEDSFLLPAEIDGVEMKQPETNSVYGIFLLSGALFLFVLFYDRNRMKEKGKVRKNQLEEDYPVLIHKIVLYLGAGMNLRNTFAQITGEYRADFNEGRSARRYAYEELNIMMNEMEAGAGEIHAYESFGSRIQNQSYGKLISLLVQNLQKGNEGLLKALEEEETNAFFMRVDRAKKEGEEAGTRLLFPMLMMLIVAMVIIMAPAILQFGGL